MRPQQHGANGKTLTCNKEVLQSETDSLVFFLGNFWLHSPLSLYVVRPPH